MTKLTAIIILRGIETSFTNGYCGRIPQEIATQSELAVTENDLVVELFNLHPDLKSMFPNTARNYVNTDN